MVMKRTGRYEADQIVNIFLIGGWFIVFPAAAIMAICSFFNWRTIILLVLMLVFLNGVSDNTNTSVVNVASTLIYPIVTFGLLLMLLWKSRIKKST